MSRRGRALTGVAAVPVVLAAILAVEVELARREAKLPDVVHRLDGPVGPAPRPGEDRRLVVWLGDSTAAGVGATEPSTTMAARVAAGLGGPVDLRVLAVSGARIEDVVEEQAPRLAGLSPDLVLVSVGANDVTHLTRRPVFRERYRRLLDAIPEGADVVLLGVPDMGSVPRFAQPLRAVAGARGRMLDSDVRHLAEARDLTYVDLAGETGPVFRSDPDRYFAGDGFHPGDEGHRVWADAVLAAVDAAGLREPRR